MQRKPTDNTDENSTAVRDDLKNAKEQLKKDKEELAKTMTYLNQTRQTWRTSKQYSKIT